MDNKFDKYILDTLNIYISIKEMSSLANISIKSIIKGIKEGYIPYKEPYQLTDDNYDEYIDNTQVPLSECQPDVIENYIRKKLSDEEYFNIDFNAFRIKFGLKATYELIEAINAIKEIECRNELFFDEPSKLVDNLFEKYGIKRRKYYDILNELKKGQLTKIIGNKSTFFKSLCPLAKDYILDQKYQLTETSNEGILEDLILLKNKHGTEICNHCPYNSLTNEYESAKELIEKKYHTFVLKECLCEKEGLIIPEDRTTIDRFVKESSPSTMYLAMHDRVLWLMNGGHQVVRKKPTKINEIAFSDHHMIDVLVLVGYTKDNEPILATPYVTVQIDAASNAITGSVVSLSPNKHTIAECLARAACITYESPFYGLPKVLYVDRGKDYRSNFIVGTKKVDKIADDKFQNRFFYDNPLLKSLNVIIKHARRKSPQTKPIERIFETIEVKYMRKVPGYIGGRKLKRLEKRREEEINRLLSSGYLWTYEKFVDYWFNVAVKKYNNLEVRNRKSPLEKYQFLQRENTLTPSWSVMSLFMQEKRKVLVSQQGIKYQKKWFYAPFLDEYIDKEVLIFDFYDPYCKYVVVYYVNKDEGINKMLGLAYLVEELDFVEKNPVKYARNMAYVKQQEKMAKDHISVVRYTTQLANIKKKLYVDFSDKDKEKLVTYYVEEIDESSSGNHLISEIEKDITKEALIAKKISLEKEKQDIEELLNNI